MSHRLSLYFNCFLYTSYSKLMRILYDASLLFQNMFRVQALRQIDELWSIPPHPKHISCSIHIQNWLNLFPTKPRLAQTGLDQPRLAWTSPDWTGPEQSRQVQTGRDQPRSTSLEQPSPRSIPRSIRKVYPEVYPEVCWTTEGPQEALDRDLYEIYFEYNVFECDWFCCLLYPSSSKACVFFTSHPKLMKITSEASLPSKACSLFKLYSKLMEILSEAFLLSQSMLLYHFICKVDGNPLWSIPPVSKHVSYSVLEQNWW